jgi:hypothetical protein
MEGQDVSAQAQTVCYSCALGDFGHSYILSQHEESRSGVAHQGAGFVAPGHPPASPCHISSPIRASQIDKNRSQKSRVFVSVRAASGEDSRRWVPLQKHRQTRVPDKMCVLCRGEGWPGQHDGVGHLQRRQNPRGALVSSCRCLGFSLSSCRSARVCSPAAFCDTVLTSRFPAETYRKGSGKLSRRSLNSWCANCGALQTSCAALHLASDLRHFGRARSSTRLAKLSIEIDYLSCTLSSCTIPAASERVPGLLLRVRGAGRAWDEVVFSAQGVLINGLHYRASSVLRACLQETLSSDISCSMNLFISRVARL